MMRNKSLIQRMLSLFGSHCLGVFLAFLVIMCVGGLLDSLFIDLLIALMSLLIYAQMIANPAWKMGNDDLRREKLGLVKHRSFGYGLGLGLLSSIPMFVLMLALIASRAQLLPDFFTLYKIANAYVFNIIRLIQFEGYIAEVTWPNLLWVCSLNFIPPLIIALSYWAGTKDILLLQRLVYRNQKKAN